VKNLCTFLCQDVEQTPTFAYARKYTRGILSFQKPEIAAPTDGKEEVVTPENAAKARLSRRGASLAFVQLSTQFGDKMLGVVPNIWQSMAGGLLSACAGGKCLCCSRGS
jgi:TATA-binding protein-associated factor